MVRPRTSSARPAMYLIWLVASPMSLRISCNGLPLSSESSRDSSSPRASIASAKASSAAARCWGSVDRQPGAARFAAAAATSTSRSSQRGMRPMTLLVEGLMTSRVAPETAPTRSPSTRAGLSVASTGCHYLRMLTAFGHRPYCPALAAEGRVAVRADPDVHQHTLAGAGGGGRGGQRGGQRGPVADLLAGLEAERAGGRAQVRVRIGDGLADPGVLSRPLTLRGHSFLVHHVVEV